MRKVLLTGVAAIFTTSFAVGQSLAACPEDIEAFQQRYDEILTATGEENVLTEEEKADLTSLQTAARELQEAGDAKACATVIYRADSLLESAIAPRAVAAEQLIDKTLTNAAGEDLGEVDEVMIDPMSGRVAYLLVEHGGFLGIGEDVFAIPWSIVRYVPGEEQLLLDISEEKLENAPRFNRTDRTPLGERDWALAVHSFYGVPPYWRDQKQTPLLARDQTQVSSKQDAGGQSGQQSAAEIGASATQSDTEISAEKDGGKAEKSTDLVELGGDARSQLQAQVAELKQRLDRQSQSLDDLHKLEQRFIQVQSHDERLAEQMQQLATQLGDVEKQLGNMSTRLEQVALKGKGSAETHKTTAQDSTEPTLGQSETGSKEAEGSSAQSNVQDEGDTNASGSSQGESREVGEAGGGGQLQQNQSDTDQPASEPGTDQQAAVPSGNGSQTGANPSTRPCSDQIVSLREELERGATKGQPKAAMDSAHEQLKIAETMATQGAEHSCLSALDQARQVLGSSQAE